MNICRFKLIILVMGALLNWGVANAANPSDLVATLSESKARAEGRARLLQSCASTKATLPADVLVKYDDARASFNSRIEALTFEIKSKKLKDFDANAELPRLNEALNRIDRFVAAADEILEKRRCSVFKKASWAKVGALLITPEAISIFIEFIQGLGSNDAVRDEFIKRCDAQRILEWTKVRLILVFDWNTLDYFAAETITPKILARGSTSVYVNEWALPTKIDAALAMKKDLPVGLSTSYKLYTGDLSKLSDFSGRF